VRDIPHPVAAVIGAGEMARKAARYLKSQPLAELLIVNRTRARAESLAAELGARALGLEEFLAAPPLVDVLVTAATSPVPLITTSELAALAERQAAARGDVPLALVDLAVPANIDADPLPPNCRLHRLEDLRLEAEQNKQRRQHEVVIAEQILARKLEVLRRRLAERVAVPILHALELATKRVQQSQVERLLKRELKHLGEDDKVLIRAFAADLARRCAHTSMPTLKQLSVPRVEMAARSVHHEKEEAGTWSMSNAR
jgi:glutamyl-tRNA reductase